MILKNILNGTLNIDVLLIKDDAHTSGLKVLKEILSGFSERNSSLNYFSYEKFHTFFDESINDIKIYDCYLLNSSWFQQDVSHNDALISLADRLIKDVPPTQQVFVIDSMNYLILSVGIQRISKLIDQLSLLKYKSGVPSFPILMILHDFNIENFIHRQLEHMCNFVINVSSEPNQDNITLNISHKKTSGKKVSENYSCWLEPESNKFRYSEIKEEVKPVESEETNMAELTTFKLTLEDKEIETRNKLVLPFMREQEKKGKIFYEPDANDDWDDEDPDDDLEI